MKQTLLLFIQNFYFLLFTFISGLFYFSFYLLGITLGLSLSFTLIGIPLLTFILRTTSTFVQYERIQTKIYTNITVQPYRGQTNPEGPFWIQAREELLDRRNWQAVLWLMLKSVIGIFSLIGAFVLYVIPLLLILAPILVYGFNVYFFGLVIDTLQESLLMTAAGLGVVLPFGWIGHRLVRMIGMYTRSIIQSLIH
ncbi:sensor domain-containing protein [Paenibacillus filicis]|uniref:Sensor domain-containing protein n=1 Tax=Paenibacillus filicis TaxID=669464 RepID=A0ABU9DKU1_9BACL